VTCRLEAFGVCIDFHREGWTFAEALRSAIRQIELAGYAPDSLELTGDLVQAIIGE
jgi:hypothetical protein